MIEYDAGYWSVSFACRVHGSVIPKALVWAVPVSLISVVAHILLTHSNTQNDETIQARRSDLDGAMSAVSLVLGFLIVFRTQKAYDRWWEAGKLLQQVRGCWFNSFSNLAAFGNRAPEKQEKLAAFVHQLSRLFSLLYGNALMQCSTSERKVFEFLDFNGFDESSMEYLVDAHDPCEVVLQWIQQVIVIATEDGIIKIAPPMLSRVYNQLGQGIVMLSGARQIKQFPIPFLLAQMVVALLLFHSMVTPLYFALKLESPHMVFIATLVCEICFWGIHYIAVELEGPYGGEANDLPLEQLQVDMNRSLASLMNRSARLAPAFSYEPGTDMTRSTVDLRQWLMQEREARRSSENSGHDGAGASVSENGSTNCPLQHSARQVDHPASHSTAPEHDCRFASRGGRQTNMSYLLPDGGCRQGYHTAAPSEAQAQSLHIDMRSTAFDSQTQGLSSDAPGARSAAQSESGSGAAAACSPPPRHLGSAEDGLLPVLVGPQGELQAATSAATGRGRARRGRKIQSFVM